jgi:flagellar basal body-associated protein FliL
LSFFDEDEVGEPTQPPRAAARPRRPGGRGGSRQRGGPSGRPPGTHDQQIQTRRLIAVVIVVVLVVASALLIHGCQVSQTNNSLKTYAGTVSEYVSASDKNGKQVFKDLKNGDAKSNLAALQLDLNTAHQNATTELQQAQDLSTPSQMASAQQSFVEMMKLRYEGIGQIASHIQGAMNRSTAVDDVSEITTGTSMLYASDVIYKTSVGTAIAAALNAAGLPIGGTTGVTINTGQVVPDLGWLNHVTVALWLGATVPSKSVNSDAPGLHGHSLNSVSVSGTTLSTATVNTIPVSKQAPTFTLNLTNGGNFNENDVVCKVSIKGVKDSAQTTIAQTTPQENTNCSVTLPTAAPTGPYTVTAEVEPVPGEKNLTNNTMVFNVQPN